nr:MAG TPA: replisome organizer [Caudoviricetes sp.]
MRLSQRGLITRYEGPDGRKYLQVNSWDKHQKINRPSKPRFPQYNAENCTLTEGSLSPHCTLTEGSLPEQGTGNREQGTGKHTLLGPSHEAEAAESASAELATVAAGAAPATANTSKPSKQSKPSRRTRAARGTRLPDGWQPDQALADWTRANAPAAANALEVERFRDYWQSIPGQRAIRVDWAATWRNWARKCQEQHAQPARGQAPRSTTDDRVNGWLALAESLDPNRQPNQPAGQPALIAIDGGAA